MRYFARTCVVIAGIIAASPAYADCGEKPTIIPNVPDGATAAREEIREARSKIIDFSNRIDTYMKCMDQRIEKLRTYMTKEQQERVAEDLNKLASVRTDIQVAINREIRAWRQAQQRREQQEKTQQEQSQNDS